MEAERDASESFSCAICGWHAPFSRHVRSGESPPFHAGIVYREDVWVVRDTTRGPVPADDRPLAVGSACGLCGSLVCHVSCSVFFGKRLCKNCCGAHRSILPAEVLHALDTLQANPEN
ncbi:Cysteine-rich DPF motif domain-containing protein 1 [Diplonema papillatum]|nr:Cysteine-rich DPF motif domain-containing protein 1 [Diplonema papillatum]|eukprot:gene17578-27063_t